MDRDDLTWRWPVAQLDALAQIAQAGDLNHDAANSVEALETRMRLALRAGHLVDDLVNRLLQALLDAGATPADVAELMGSASTQVMKRRAGRERHRLNNLAADT